MENKITEKSKLRKIRRIENLLKDEEIQNMCKDFFQVYESESRTAGYKFIQKKYPKLCEKVSGNMDDLLSAYRIKFKLDIPLDY